MLNYVARGHSREVLALMARMLEFTPDDERKVGLRVGGASGGGASGAGAAGEGGRLGGLLGRVVAPGETPQLPEEVVESASLSKLWVAFLEAECDD